MKLETRPRKRLQPALLVSLVLHVAVFLIVGDVVLQKGLVRREGFTSIAMPFEEAVPEVAPLEDAPPDPDPAAELSTDAGLEGDIMDTAVPEVSQSLVLDVISTDAASPYAVNSGPVPVLKAPATGAGTGKGQAGTGSGAGRPGGGVKAAKLFGTEVEARHLGAVIDVSGSASPYLMLAFSEIRKNFQDPVIVMGVGCALFRDKGEVRPFGTYDLTKQPDKNDNELAGVRYLMGAMSRDKDLERLVGKLHETPDVYLLADSGLDVTMAFRKLIDEKVDAIYWFADFRDSVRQEQAEALAKELKRRGIRLYIHSFTGQPIPPIQAEMVEVTGGKSIVVVPK